MANRNNETTTRFNVDISELKKAMQDAKRQIQVANSEFKAVSSSMENWGKSTDGLQAKLKQLDSNLKSQKTILRSLESQYEAVVREQGEGSAAADRLKVAINNQRATINNTERQVRNYSEALNTAERAEEIAARTGRDAAEVFDELADNADEAGNAAEKSSGGFTVMKGALASLVADGIRLAIDALKDFAKQSIQTGMNFEASMSEVAAISGATGKDFELLENTAKEFGATTTFSASEAAQALKYMALAGWDAEKSSSALGGVLDLAAASGMDLAQASDMVTDYMSAFGMEADKSGYFADLLAYAQSHANTSAEQLGEAYKNTAANMNAAGQDVETVTALLSMMANQGFKGSEAGTALTAMMRDMTAKMKDGKIAIGKSNVEVMDAQGNYRDLTDILKDVEAATNGMGDAERATALKTTFTADSTKGLNLLLNAGVGEAEKFEEALRGAGGSAGDMAEVMNNNLAGDVKAAQSALEDLQITAYEELQPTLREIVQYATEKIIPMIKNDIIPAVKEFIGWIVDNKDEVIAGLAGIAAGFLAFNIVSMIQGVVKAFKAFKAAQEGATVAQWLLNAAMAANPIGLIVAAIAALVAAFVVLWNKSDAFREFWINLWNNVKEVFSSVVDGIKAIWGKITEFFSGVLDGIKNIFSGIGSWFGEKFTQAKENSETAWANAKERWSQISDGVKGAFSSIGSWFGEKFTQAKENSETAWANAKEKWSQISDGVKSAFSSIGSWFKDKFTQAKENSVNAWANVKDKFSGFKDKITGAFSNLGSNLKDKFSTALEQAKAGFSKASDIGKNLVEGLWNGISDMTSWIGEKIKGFGESVVSGLKDFFGIHSPSKLMEKEIGKFLPEGIAVGIDKNAKTVLDSMRNLTANTLGAATQGLQTVSATTGSAVGGTVNNFYQTINSPKQLSRLDIYRQSKNLLGYAGGGL